MKIIGLIILLFTVNSCRSQKGTSTDSINVEQMEQSKYNKDDIICSIGFTKHNTANPQYNYVVTVYGDGRINRKGGVYKKSYPDVVSKDVLDNIVKLGGQINKAEMVPKSFIHDGPTCSLVVYGSYSPFAFCTFKSDVDTKLLHYIGENIILPEN